VKIIYYPDERSPTELKQAVIAIGNFDGLHRGHSKLIESVCRRSKELSVPGVVLLFDPHPSRIVRPDKVQPVLMTKDQKIDFLEKIGIDGVAVIRFTKELSLWNPERFVREVLVEWIGVSEVWVGENFLFGREKAGNFSLLKSLGNRYGFRVKQVDPVRYKEFVISSTRIRRLLSDGHVDEAGALLGYHYFIDGDVVVGSQRGQSQGFPTANLRTDNETMIPNGVYATVAKIEKIMHQAVTNVGVRPTFKTDGQRVIEVHLLDYDADLYGRHVRLSFVKRLRDEETFPGTEALQRQIITDCKQARELFSRISL